MKYIEITLVNYKIVTKDHSKVKVLLIIITQFDILILDGLEITRLIINFYLGCKWTSISSSQTLHRTFQFLISFCIHNSLMVGLFAKKWRLDLTAVKNNNITIRFRPFLIGCKILFGLNYSCFYIDFN